MKNVTRTIPVFFVLVIGLLFAALAVQAQEQTATPEAGTTGQDGQTSPIFCESSLMLLVALAQRDYGFQPSVDVSQFEYGQYRNYYGGMMGTGDMGTGDTGTDMMATDEADMMATDEAGTTDGSMMLLNPPLVLNEDLRCTELRTSVEAFFATDRRPMGMGSDMGTGMGGSEMNVTATPAS